jgi:hypothetical protein
MAADLSDVYSYIAIFGVFFYMLHKLLQFAKKQLDREFPSVNRDEFYKSYGYSYDYILVFKVHDEDDDFYEKYKENDYKKNYTFGKIWTKIQRAGLEVNCFFSCQRDEIYMKIRAKPSRLCGEASRINYRLLLDPDRVRSRLNLGKRKAGGEYSWKPVRYIDEFKQSRLSPYDYIYSPYDADAFKNELYKMYDCDEGHKLAFRPVDR